MKAKLELAISFLTTLVSQSCLNLEEVVASDLKLVGQYAEPLARAERLLDGLNKYSRSAAATTLRHRLGALEVLKEMLQQVESDPAKELSYEFSVGREGDDYLQGRDISVPIAEANLLGRTLELVGTLRLVQAEIEWPARQNGFKARFVIKAGVSQ